MGKLVATGILQVGAKDADKHPAKHRIAPHNYNYTPHNKNYQAWNNKIEIENPYYNFLWETTFCILHILTLGKRHIYQIWVYFSDQLTDNSFLPEN